MKEYNDLYIRYLGHPLYNPTLIESDDPLDNTVQQMEMILFTEPGEVFGDSNFGAGVEHYLWQTNFPADIIQANIISQFSSYIPELSTNSYTVNVYIQPGQIQDIGIVDIVIDGTILRAVFM